ncbi:MAG: ROK family protein [Treponema sp.]|jgi:glucokinase|nr:ROK family protein [Treponema sp.]
MEQYTVGVDVGGTKTAYGLLDGGKNIVARLSHGSDAACSPEAFFGRIAGNVRELMAAGHVRKGDLRGVGVGVPSFVLFEEGRIVKTSNLPNLRDFPARAYLAEKLGGVRVILDNDAHAAAIAEHRLGAGRGFDSLLYCPVSTGISSAIIIGGRIFRGSYGWSGESGHMIMTPDDGVECGCGNRGCVMSWCSGSMIAKHVQNWIDAGERSCIPEFAGGGEISCLHIERAYNAGDALARRAVAQMIKYLGVWTYNLYVTFNISCFVFGGGLLKMWRNLEGDGKGGNLLESMKAVFDGYNRNDMPVYFKEAELGDDFGVIGASELLF